MGPRAGVDMMAKRKHPCPCWESNPGYPACSLVTTLAELSQVLVMFVLVTVNKA